MTQVVVKHDEQEALQAWGNAQDEPWEDDGNSDIQPSFPVIKIVQPTSTMPDSEKHVGEFYFSDIEAFAPEIECVGLVKRDTRAYFIQGDDQPQCMSADGIAPLDGMKLWANSDNGAPNGAQPQFCDQCPFGSWGTNDTPPPCKSSLVVLVARANGDLAQLRIGGKSIRPYKQFVAKKLRPKKLPLYSQRLVLSTEMKSEPGKRWAELVIESQTMTPTEALKFNHILQDQRRRFEESVAADGGRVEVWTDDAPANAIDPDDLPFE